MNKIGVVVVVSLLVIAVSPSYAFSQSFGKKDVNFQDDVITSTEIELAGTLPDPGILPDHPLYFLKQAGERMMLFLAFNDEDKAGLHLGFAKARLAEAKQLVEHGKSLEKSIDDFNLELNRAKDAKEARVRKEADDLEVRSTIVLAQVLEKVPAGAKPAIERALNSSIEKSGKIEKLSEIRSEIKNAAKTGLETGEKIKETMKEGKETAKKTENNRDEDIDVGVGSVVASTGAAVTTPAATAGPVFAVLP